MQDFKDKEKGFDDASETCTSLGSKLFGPKTKAINDEIATEARNVIGSNGYWLGINDEGTEGTWVYNSDGQEISWTWMTQQTTDLVNNILHHHIALVPGITTSFVNSR